MAKCKKCGFEDNLGDMRRRYDYKIERWSMTEGMTITWTVGSAFDVELVPVYTERKPDDKGLPASFNVYFLLKERVE